jgi:hypothetical protein
MGEMVGGTMADEPRFATIYDELVDLMGDPFAGRGLDRQLDRQVERDRAGAKRRRAPRATKATDKPEKTKPSTARP